MAQNTKGLKGQGHTSRSSVKVTYLYTALRLLLLNKHKKFEDDAIARFCCSASGSKRRKKKNHGDHSNNNTDREYLSVSNNICLKQETELMIYFQTKQFKYFSAYSRWGKNLVTPEAKHKCI